MSGYQPPAIPVAAGAAEPGHSDQRQWNGTLATAFRCGQPRGIAWHTAAYGGSYSLGQQAAWADLGQIRTGTATPVVASPYRRVISCQAIFRREVFSAQQ